MELREYIRIFRKNFSAFLIVVIVFVMTGTAFYLMQSESYRSSLTLNITRKGIQETDDYRYDDFYRLQADERFADTVVRWLQSPRIVSDIYNDAGISVSGVTNNQLSKLLSAKRLSSQVIEIEYSSGNTRTSQSLSDAIVKGVNNESEKLDETQSEETWFVVVGGYPVIEDGRVGFWRIIFMALFLGIFLGIIAAFIRHYAKGGDNHTS